MFLALADYIAYRTRSGQYSHPRLIERGLRLATLENFHDYRKYTLGHILFASTSNSVLSWAVMYSTNSPLSHTAVIFGDGIVNDCTTSGVVRHSFANYLDGRSYLMVLPPPPTVDLELVKERMDQTLGDPYSWPKVFRVFLYILAGSHSDFHWRLSIDFIVLLAAVWALAHWALRIPVHFLIISITAYMVVVVINQTLLRSKRP